MDDGIGVGVTCYGARVLVLRTGWRHPVHRIGAVVVSSGSISDCDHPKQCELVGRAHDDFDGMYWPAARRRVGSGSEILLKKRARNGLGALSTTGNSLNDEGDERRTHELGTWPRWRN